MVGAFNRALRVVCCAGTDEFVGEADTAPALGNEAHDSSQTPSCRMPFPFFHQQLTREFSVGTVAMACMRRSMEARLGEQLKSLSDRIAAAVLFGSSN